MRGFFQLSMFVIRVPTENESGILFGSEYKRELSFSQNADDNSILVR